MKASEWIDRLKAARGWATDYRAAKELGFSRNTISNWRQRPDATMDDDTALKVADALGEHPAIVLLDQAAERSKSDRARSHILEALEAARGKLRAAGGRPRLVAAGGGTARVDITSVTLAGGDPAELHRNTHRIEQDPDQVETLELQRATSEAFLLQMLANRHAAQSSYRPAFSRR